jgi:hypothetical protein
MQKRNFLEDWFAEEEIYESLWDLFGLRKKNRKQSTHRRQLLR